MPLGKSDLGQIPLDGPCDSVNSLSDYLHLTSASPEQGLEHCKVFTEPIRSKHDHTHDGRYLPRLFGLLRLDQY